MEKKNIGNVFAMYPTPLGVIGTLDSETGKVNFMEIGHIGIMSHSLLSLSLHKAHLSTDVALKEKKVAFNFVNEQMLQRADYVGMVSGKNTDKSSVFAYKLGEAGTPIIDDADCAMELEVINDFEIDGFHNLVCKVTNTYVNPEMIDEKGKPDYEVFKPILFEMPSYKYLATGKVIGKCLELGKQLKAELSTNK